MRLFRISNILLLATAAFFGVLLFWTSQAVQKKEDELAGFKKNLTQERETIRVLAVEWDYLNRPQRLEKLAKEQLGMEAPSGAELVSGFDQIPEPVVPATAPGMFAEEGIAQAVSMVTEEPAPKAVPALQKPETVAPSSAEKESFYQLIQRLDAEGTR